MQDANDTALPEIDDGLDEALASLAPEPESPGDEGGEPEAEQPAAESDNRARDERGRFAKAEAEAPETAPTATEPEEKDAGAIPGWRLRELREERDRIAAERERDRRELEALRQQHAIWQQQFQRQQATQEAPERPDPISDPEGYHAWWEQRLEQRESQLTSQFRDQWVNLTFAEQREKDGDTFDKALAALEGIRDPSIATEIRESVNPGRALMRWFKDHTAKQEIGGDLNGYLQRKQEEWLKDPEVRKRIFAEMEAEARGASGAQRSSGIEPLPSVNRASGSASRHQPGDLGSTDKEIFESLTRRR